MPRNEITMTQPAHNPPGHGPPPGIPFATNAWALSAFGLGFLHLIIWGFLSCAVLIPMFWMILPFTVPPFLLSMSFLGGAIGVRRDRPGARSQLRSCAGIAIIGNVLLLVCCTEFLADEYPIDSAVDYRIVVTLLVAIAQLLYCIGLFWYMRPLPSSTGPLSSVVVTPYRVHSVSPTSWALGTLVVLGVIACIVWTLTFSVARPKLEAFRSPPNASVSHNQAQHQPTLRPEVLPQSPSNGAASYSPTDSAGTQRQAPPPTAEQVRMITRQTEQAAPGLLGGWLYPGARVIPFEPRPGPIAFPTMALQTTDDLQTVMRFYDRLASNGHNTEKGYILEGQRPGDGQTTEIWIGTSQGGVFIRFDSH